MRHMGMVRAGSPTVRWLARSVASVAMVAAMTGLVALLRGPVSAPSLLVLHLLVVLPVAVWWGTWLAVATAVLSVLSFEFFFVAPFYTFVVGDIRDLVGLGAFLVTAIVVGQLAARLHEAAWAAARMGAEQAALRRVATLVARSAAPSTVFEAVAREVGLLCGADLARLDRYEPDGTVTAVAVWSPTVSWPPPGTRFDLDGPSVAREVRRTGAPARIDSYEGAAGMIAQQVRAAGIRSSVGCPIEAAGRLWGVVTASTRSEHLFPPSTDAQIADFTELVATAVENAEARSELRASRARVVATADQTRRRIERDLHDGAQQRLVSLALQLRAAQAGVPPELDELGEQLDRAVADLSDALDELREMGRGIHPAILAQGGLAPALKALARRSSVPVELKLNIEQPLPDPVEISAYYVVAEALTNAIKHAGAPAVTITAEVADQALRVLVRDEGRGGADFARGTGLVGLKDRVEAIGGRVVLDSPHGTGTTLSAELPLGEG